MREIQPVPTEEEVVAIVAACEALWARPAVAPNARLQPRESAWRFSGRWWAKPVAVRRDRPFP